MSSAHRRDDYAGFARHYDLHGWDWWAEACSGRLFDLLDRLGMSAARILDAGCGTGTLALLLASRGHQVTGIDLSEAMLQEARRKDSNGVVTWLRGDVRSFDLLASGRFDLIVCVADILNHLEGIDEWMQALGRFRLHLRPGGWLLLDAVTCAGLERMDRHEVIERDDLTLIVGSFYDPASRRSTLRATSFVRREPTGLFDRAREIVTEWGQPVEEIVGAVSHAGFATIERIWSSGRDPEREPRLTLLARNPQG